MSANQKKIVELLRRIELATYGRPQPITLPASA